jgi:hypothetical protein
MIYYEYLVKTAGDEYRLYVTDYVIALGTDIGNGIIIKKLREITVG